MTDEIPVDVDVPIEKEENDEMRQYSGVMPGGGLLNVYELDLNSFGVIGARSFDRLDDTLKRNRSAGFREIVGMLKAFKLMGKGEKVISVSKGTLSGGRQILIVVTLSQVEKGMM